jgi:class 3 adenylate cyclase
MTTRRLAAILAADVVGFSKMMEHDEEGTLARVKALQREVIEPKLRERGGRLGESAAARHWRDKAEIREQERNEARAEARIDRPTPSFSAVVIRRMCRMLAIYPHAEGA